MDISNTIQPDSSQLNADDLLSHSIVVTVREVTEGTSDQPVNIHTVEYPDRAYRPSKTMRRIIVMAWGSDSSQYAGRRMELFRNPDIAFGGKKVGGIQISRMSDMNKPLTTQLTVSRGKHQKITVEPLPDQQSAITDDMIDNATTVDELRAMWSQATLDQQQKINARATALAEQGEQAQ